MATTFDDLEPLLPTRGYRIHTLHGDVIDLQAEGMLPCGKQLRWTITTTVIGLPRVVVVQRVRRSSVDLVLRDGGAVWPAAA